MQKKTVNISGFQVHVSENPGAPLLLLVRMAAAGMGLWDRLWDYLTPYYTVANFDLPTPVIDEAASPVDMFKDYARTTVQIAKGLGHDRFHLFGWIGGARVAIRCLVDYPQYLQSCVIQGLADRPADVRFARKNAEVVNLILESGNLELYTYNWLLSGLSPDYAASHFNEVEELVRVRLEADRGRMDTRNVQKWIRMLGRLPVSEEELRKVNVPTLLIAPSERDVKQLHGHIKSSSVAVVPGLRQFTMMEDPAALWSAVGPFMRSAARAVTPVAGLAHEEASLILRSDVGGCVQVLATEPKDAIVFLHGWLMSPEMWAAPLAALSDRTRCLALWQPGHGRTSAPPPGFSMSDWVEWLARILDSQGIQRAVLVGHSMGGMLALAMAAQHPARVKGMVLVDTQDTTWDNERVAQWQKTVQMIATAWGPQLAPNIAGFLLGQKFISGNQAWLDRWAQEVSAYDLKGQIPLGLALGQRADVSPYLAGFRMPVLVTHGSVDQAIPVETGRAMASRIPGSEFVEIAGAAHCPPLEAPAEFTAALMAFLKSHALL